MLACSKDFYTFLVRYEEVCTNQYTFGNSPPSGTLHFTQVVWEGTKELGIGMATGTKDGMNCTYVVGRYRPAGNFAGQYEKNVLKGSFDQNVCKKLESIVKEIEDSSKHKSFDSVATDDKFGEEKAAGYGDKSQFDNSKNGEQSTLFKDKNQHSQSYYGKIPYSSEFSGHSSSVSKQRPKDKGSNDNVIQLDEKSESVEEAEKLIKNSKEKENKRIGTKGSNNAKKLKGKSSGGGMHKSNINDKYSSEMKITSGVPLSRNSTLKRKENGGQHFLIKTNFEPSGEQRQLDSTSDDFAQKGLAAHNAFRKIHKTSAMTLDSILSQEAEEYAKVLAERGSLIHSKTGGKYGENLAMGCTGKDEEMSAEEATKTW